MDVFRALIFRVFDVFISLFGKIHVGWPVHLNINLVSPYMKYFHSFLSSADLSLFSEHVDTQLIDMNFHLPKFLELQNETPLHPKIYFLTKPNPETY